MVVLDAIVLDAVGFLVLGSWPSLAAAITSFHNHGRKSHAILSLSDFKFQLNFKALPI